MREQELSRETSDLLEQLCQQLADEGTHVIKTTINIDGEKYSVKIREET